MSKVRSIYDGFAGFNGVPVPLAVGDEYDSNDPLVLARPELFSEPPQAKKPAAVEPEPQPEPEPEPAPEPPAEVAEAEPAPAVPAKRRGRPPGSRNKPRNG